MGTRISISKVGGTPGGGGEQDAPFGVERNDYEKISTNYVYKKKKRVTKIQCVDCPWLFTQLSAQTAGAILGQDFPFHMEFVAVGLRLCVPCQGASQIVLAAFQNQSSQNRQMALKENPAKEPLIEDNTQHKHKGRRKCQSASPVPGMSS